MYMYVAQINVACNSIMLNNAQCRRRRKLLARLTTKREIYDEQIMCTVKMENFGCLVDFIIIVHTQ